MKRIIFLAFAVAACFGLLLACNSDGGDETTKYKVSFDLNLPTDIAGVTAADTPASVTVEKGKTVTLPATITNSSTHNHTGWFVTESGGTALTTPYTPTKNITLYAQWTSKGSGDDTKWRVTFDYNNGTPADSPAITFVDVTKGQAVGSANWPKTPTKGTDTFDGWFEDGNATAYTSATPITKNVTIKAKWTAASGGGLTSAPVKVGAETQDVDVTASTGATVEYIEGGYKVATSSNYGPHAWFKVNLGTGKSIADFKEVTFTYNPVSGDTTFKTIYLEASDEAFPPSLNTDNAYKTLEVAGSYWGSNPEPNVTATIGKDQGNYIPVLSTADEINFSIYLHANAISYEITNITFVPAPTGHQAVTAIAGVATEIKAGEEFELSGFVFPPYATNKTIVWSLKNAGTTGVTAITDGKFTPAAGTITVTATVANGATATTPYTQDFVITVFVPGAQISVNVGGTTQTGITVSANSGSAELDVVQIDGGYQFTTTGGYNSYSYFQIDLGAGKTFANVSAVKATVGVSGSDANYKKFGVTASATVPTAYPGEPSGEWNHGNSTSDITLIKKDATVSGNTVYLIIYGHLPAGQTVQITNVKIEFTP
jgi:uncharacterized repeat protein (TIGR02543 family)